MKIGVIFPQTEIIADASAVSRYAQEVERMGFAHVCAYDHVQSSVETAVEVDDRARDDGGPGDPSGVCLSTTLARVQG